MDRLDTFDSDRLPIFTSVSAPSPIERYDADGITIFETLSAAVDLPPSIRSRIDTPIVVLTRECEDAIDLGHWIEQLPKPALWAISLAHVPDSGLLSVVRRLGTGAMIVDPCCGEGEILQHARALGFRAVGFESDTLAIENAINRLTLQEHGAHQLSLSIATTHAV